MKRFLNIFFVLIFLFSFRGGGFVERVYPFLIGEYIYIKSVSDDGVFKEAVKDTLYTVKITKKDRIIFYRDGKVTQKSEIEETTLPFLDDQNHLVIGNNNEFEPVFFRGDTLVIQSYPCQYTENYFVKKR